MSTFSISKPIFFVLLCFLQDESHEASKERAPSASPFLMVSPGHQVLLMENNKDEFLEVLDNDGLARAVICLVGIYYDCFPPRLPGPCEGSFSLSTGAYFSSLSV